MNNQIKSFLLLTTSLLILLSSTCISQDNASQNQDFKVVFPMNKYLTTKGSSPYPVLVQEKFQHINTSSFVNVMNYGASGDGSKGDDDAIAKAFAACKDGSGVLFPQGKTFLIQNLTRIPLNKNITVYAYGATFKMADNTGYNAIAFEGNDNGYSNQVIWLGGVFDGNKDHQAWPGSPTGNNNWTVTQSNYGLLTIRRANFALVKDLSLINTVYDGVELFECKLGVIADSKAENGVPLQYDKVEEDFDQGKQATYFKVTRQGSQTAYFMNLLCKGGSIGIHFSSKPVNDSSLAVVTNCKLYNQVQDALHFEHCRKVFIDNVVVDADDYAYYHSRVHISNATEIGVVSNSTFRNARVDFRNAAALKIGVVQNCNFLSSGQSNDKIVRNFIQSATYVFNCTFDGLTQEEQVQAKYIDQSTFKNFKLALRGPHLVTKCTFSNGDSTVRKLKNNNTLNECTFTNVRDNSQHLSAFAKNNDDYMKDQMSMSIEITDERGKLLGKIAK